MGEIDYQNEKYKSYKRREMRTNLDKLPIPHKLAQSPPNERVQRKLQVAKTHLPPIGLVSLPKNVEEG